MSRIASIAVSLATLIALVLVASPSVEAADCAAEEAKIGIVEAKGCFTKADPKGDGEVLQTGTQFTMNGFTVKPQKGTTVTFQPANQKRGASVDTGNGFVDMSAANTSWGPVNFNNMNFAVSPPNKGELVLSESVLAQPYAAIAGLTPLGVKQPLTLTEEGAEFNLSFSLGGVFFQLLTGSEKERSFTLDFKVAGGKYDLSGGKVGLSGFELAKLVEVHDFALELGATKFAADVDATFKAIPNFGVIGGVEIDEGKLQSFKIGASELNKPLGSSGIFLQKLAAEIKTAAPYGGTGLIGITAGPKMKFLGKDVAAVDVDGSIQVSGEDTAKKVPAFFKAGGNFKIVTIPVGNASFAYYFGQGTDMSASIGIGIPSGTNDPGQPNYIGGSFRGWTTARNFDMEGDARLKVLGLQLAGAKAVVSDYGMAGCLQVIAWVGGGIRWSDGRGEMLGGWSCNIGAYQRQRSAELMAERKGKALIDVDDDVRVIRVHAAEEEEAPDVNLVDENGEVVMEAPDDDDEDGIAHFDDGAAISGSEDNMTAFVLEDDAGGGRFSLEEQPGSSSIERISFAGELPPHNVRARITGKGRKKVLHWRARNIPHQTLQFTEVLPGGREIPILETGKHRGKRKFLPAEGPKAFGVKRKLEVDVLQRFDTPRDEVVADRYKIRRQPAPRKVKRLRTRWEPGEVVVRWRKSARAQSYEIAARPLGSNAVYKAHAPRGARRLKLPVGTTDRLRITVTPISVQDRRGPAAKRTIKTPTG